MITALRTDNHALFEGPWVTGELLATTRGHWPAMAPLTDLSACACEPETCRQVVLGEHAVAAVHDIDWAARTGRIEVALLRDDEGDASCALADIVSFAFADLNLHRIWGWVTPDDESVLCDLARHGFACEARIPAAHWHDGALRDREIWGQSCQ